MAAKELKEVRERDQLRRLFTRSTNQTEEYVKKKEFTQATIEFNYIMEKFTRLEILDERIQSRMLEAEEFDEAQYQTEVETAEVYKHKLCVIKNLIQTSPSKLTAGSPEQKGKTTNRNFKLPQIVFKQFDDEPLNWLGFWGQFQKIHDDDTLSSEDKFQYLIQATKEGSSARNLVESFPPSADNYNKALEQLQDRFGREDLLIQVYIRQLLKLVLNHNKEQVSVKSLYDKLSSYLMSLESLGVVKQKYEVILYPLVESAIPETILLAFNRSCNQTKDQLTKLVQFLKSEVEMEERIRLARSDFNCVGTNPSLNSNKPESSLPTAAALVSNMKPHNNKERTGKDFQIRCCFCNQIGHSNFECSKGNKMSLEEKTRAIKRQGCCYLCLRPGHTAAKCRSFIKCLNCQKKHLVIMCPEIHKKQSCKTSENVLVCARNNTTTLLQTLIVNIAHGGKVEAVRALLDSGSQRSYVKAAVVKKLGLQSTGTESMSHILFGGERRPVEVYECFELPVSSVDNSFFIKINALQQDNLCGHLPKLQNVTILEKLRDMNIKISDNNFADTEIGLLIGSDYLGSIITDRLVYLDNNLMAVNTNLGWTIQGPIEIQTTTSTMNVSCFSKANLSDLWSVELLGIKEPYEKRINREMETEILSVFNNNISVNAQGRYEVPLVWKEGRPELHTNYEVACKRLETTTRKLKSTGNLNSYNKVLQDWKKDGIIEEVTENRTDMGHYLPHQIVIKPSSTTTKVRPVFDASTKDRNGWSLNDCINKGVNMIELLPKLLIQFRKGTFGVVSDIRQAFLQISITERDRDYLKFLWYENIEMCDKIVTLRHKRVVFGITCSPFLLSATIKHHLEKCTGACKKTADKLKESFYVDNCVTSFDTINELKTFITESKAIMSNSKFDLRGWVTAPHRIDNTVTVSVLGLTWNTLEDSLHCNMNINETIPEKITKRNVMSIVQHVFDPLGFVCPVTLIPKLIMQKVWEQKINWDKEIPIELTQEFKKWLKTAHMINKYCVPRCMTPVPVEKCETSLHVFCDASQNSYASCIYLRVEHNEKVYVQLVLAKNRVAPANKKMSLPRLELMGALIASRLYKEVIESGLLANCKYYRVYFWTDSAVTLAWIKRQTQWKTFVSNRVKEICSTTDRNDWHHLPGESNPADLPSRGCSAAKLLESKWHEGPDWLKCNIEDWPKSKVGDCNEELVLEEQSRSVVVNTDVTVEPFSRRLMYFSKYNKIVRLVAWILRFNSKVRKKFNVQQNDITNDEYINAEKSLFKLLQRENFIQGKIPNNLNTSIDDEGILRVNTRLELSQEDKNFVKPILLSGKNEIVQRLVRQRHERLSHAGTQFLLSNIRNDFWVLNIRRLVKGVVLRCVICKRSKSKHYEVPEAPLPTGRIEATAAFQVTGIDLAGPLYLRDQSKCWIVLFTCATYRAVHLELVESLGTSSMLMALRRFIARRGRINVIYTDNGGNFQGCSNYLKEVNWTEIEAATAAALPPIIWRLIPPRAPWWGGWWERLIKVVKEMLRRILGKQSVTYIELSTLLCDCEAVINNRPLTYVVTADDSLKPLTPMMFLQPLTSTDIPDLDQIDTTNLNVRLNYLQKLRNDFRQRFRNEYLALICSKDRCKPRFPKVNDIVLIETESSRLFWPLGIIRELFTGADGHSRVAKLQTATGELVRAVQRLYPLELTTVTDEWHRLHKDKGKSDSNLTRDTGTDTCVESDRYDDAQIPPVTTRHGRLVKMPHRFLD